MRILIVDDNPTNVIIIREILKKEDYRNFITASSAKEMLKLLGIGGEKRTAAVGYRFNSAGYDDARDGWNRGLPCGSTI